MKRTNLFIGLICVLFSACGREKESILYVGTYTENNSEGIYSFGFKEETGDLIPAGITPNLENPSFLAISPDEKYLYAVSEVKESPEIDSGSVTAYRILSSGQLEKINRKATKGYHPCHVEVSPDGNYLVASNYTSGSLSFYKLAGDGGLEDSFQQIQHEGAGPDLERQESPHAHSSRFTSDGKFLISADLGTDRLDFYTLDNHGIFVPARQEFVGMLPGSGPRHFDFSPDGQFIYVMNEMASTVSVLKKMDDEYQLVESVSSLPEGYEGIKAGADIHLSADGRFVYCSNRGHNSIAVFKRNDDGTIVLVQNEPVHGDWPRNFAISPDGGFLLVANQRSDNITIFKIDPQTGLLQFTGKQYKLPRPVCLKFKKSL